MIRSVTVRKTAFLLVLVTTLTANAQFGAKPVAVVNGESIARTELDAALKIRPQALVSLSASQTRELQEQVLAMLIDETLMRQFLAKNIPPADPSEIDRQFKALVTSLKTNGKTFDDYCKETQQTERQVRVGIEVMLRWTAHVEKKISEADLQKYFADNKDFFEKVTVKCSHIVLRIPTDASSSDKAGAEKKLRELRQQIISGQMSFADAARKYSHCPSAPKGGNLGYIYRKWMVDEPFAKSAFALKVNEISEPVWTDSGIHLILVTDRKPAEPADFNKIRFEVRDCCSEEMRMNLLSDLRKSAKVEINLP
jgi:peptidyl-prolyl cis-trans isomerase C